MQEKIDKLKKEVMKLDAKYQQTLALVVRSCAKLPRLERQRKRIERRISKIRKEMKEQQRWAPLGPPPPTGGEL